MLWARSLLSLVAGVFLLFGVCGGRCDDHDDDGAQKHPAGLELHLNCHCVCQSLELPAAIVLPPVPPPIAAIYPVLVVNVADQFVPQPEPPPVIVA
jgi:hypothetical protein